MDKNLNKAELVNAGVNMTIREDLVDTAINFLNNPNVRRSPWEQKQKFLKSKGLTENEIHMASERVRGQQADPTNTFTINMDSNTPQSSNLLIPKQSILGKFKDILTSIALISGALYALYVFYKNFIEPFIFGRKKKKTVEESLGELNEKFDIQVKKINNQISQVHEEVVNYSRNDNIFQDISNFKRDLDAIKGLLLNKKQFATPLTTVPPSIPAWQLASQHHRESEQDKNDDTGSGSSETEVVTKNSDSSLEIM